MAEVEIKLTEWVPLSKQRGTAWDKEDDLLWLLTPAELETMPAGTTLHSISGEQKVVGTDYIDNDTRAGYLAYGLRESQLPFQR